MSFKNIKQNLISSLEVEDGRTFDKSNGFIGFRILEEAGVATTSMATITFSIKGFVDLKDLHVAASYGYAFEDDEEYISFGPFIVDEQTYDKKLDRSTFTGFDLMLEMCKVAKLDGIEYPITATRYLTELADRAGVNSQIERIDYTITEDVYSNTGHEYRSITEDIAELSNQIMFFKGGMLVNKTSKETGIKLIKKNITGFSLLPKFGPVDSLVLSRYPQEDNVYPESVDPENVNHEIKFADNLLIERKREEVIDDLFNKYKGLSWQPFTLKTVGIGFIELGDIITVEIDDEIYRLEVLGKELTVAGGIFETLFCNEIKKSTTRYQFATDSRRKQLTTDLIVDKQSGEIKSLVKQVGDRTDKETSLTQDVDNIEFRVKSAAVGTNLIKNLNALHEITEEGYPFFKFFENEGGAPGFYPPQYPLSRTSYNFVVKQDEYSVSGYAKEFFVRGMAQTEKAYIVPDTIYSYRCKRTMGNEPFNIKVTEYDSSNSIVNTSLKKISGLEIISTFTITPNEKTKWIDLTYITLSNNIFRIAEEMFVRGEPVNWSEDVRDVKEWAEAKLTVQSEMIEARVEKNGIIAAINLSSEVAKIMAKYIQLEGIITANGNIKIFEDGSIEVNKGVFRGEINTDENVRVGTYLKMPLPAGESITDIMQFTKLGYGGISWGEKGNNLRPPVSITAYDRVGPIAALGNILYIRANEIGLTADRGIQLQNSFNGTTASQVDLQQNGLFLSSYNGSVWVSGKTGTRLESEEEIRLESDKKIYLSNPSFQIEMSQDNERLFLLNKSQGGTLKGVFLEKWGNLLPYNGVNLGWVDYRFSNIYLINQPNVSSDKRLKYNITDIDELLLDSFESLREKYFKTTHDDMHSFGYIAQDVEACLYDYARKVWDEEEVEKQMSLFKVLSRDGEYMSLLYGEVKVIMLAVLRRDNERVKEENRQLRSDLDSLISILKEKEVI